jgi:hypothetical protein
MSAEWLWVISLIGSVVFFTIGAITAHGAEHWVCLGLILLSTGLLSGRRPQ